MQIVQEQKAAAKEKKKGAKQKYAFWETQPVMQFAEGVDSSVSQHSNTSSCLLHEAFLQHAESMPVTSVDIFRLVMLISSSEPGENGSIAHDTTVAVAGSALSGQPTPTLADGRAA
jgi:hypothetical protein